MSTDDIQSYLGPFKLYLFWFAYVILMLVVDGQVVRMRDKARVPSDVHIAMF